MGGFSQAGGALTASNLIMHNFVQHGRTARVLFALSGHKIAVHQVPNEPVQQEVKMERAYFSDRNGHKMRRNNMAAVSIALLPLRKLMLIGCDDGLVRVVT